MRIQHPLPIDLLVSNFDLKPLFKNQEHINLIKDVMFSSSNEPEELHTGIENKIYFAETGSSQIKRLQKSKEKLRLNKKATI